MINSFKKTFLIRLLVLMTLFSIVVPFTASVEASSHEKNKPLTVSSYEPLADLPYVYDKDGAGERSLQTVLDGFFKLLIASAIVLSVLMITFAGVQYLTTSATGKKESAKQRIRNVLFGLLLALFSWLILNTINPNLVNPSLSVDVDGLKSYLEILPENSPEGDGYFYKTFNSTLRGTNEEGVVVVGAIVYKGFSGYEGTAVGFVTKKSCEEIAEKQIEASKCEEDDRASCQSRETYVIEGGNCSYVGTASEGPWFFKYKSKGLLSLVGESLRFATEELCKSSGMRLENQNEGTIIKKGGQICQLDSSADSGSWPPGWYIVLKITFTRTGNVVEQIKNTTPYTTKEACDEEIKTYTPTQSDVKREECFEYGVSGERVSSNNSSLFDQIMAPKEGGDLPEQGIWEELKRRSGGKIIGNRYPTRCKYWGDECTSIGLLPDNAIDGLIFLSSRLPSEILMVTGGTEQWLHDTHGPGKAVVDIKTLDTNGEAKLTAWDEWIIDNTPNRPSKIPIETWDQIRELNIGDPFRPEHRTLFTVDVQGWIGLIEFYYERTVDHWHVIFP